jgi:putative membrane protein
MDSMPHMNVTSNGFFTQWSPGLLLSLIVITYLYFQLIGPLRQRFTGSSPVSLGRKLLFITAIIIFYTAQGSPINYYSHGLSFSFHMFQQTLVYLILPPILFLSLPDWLIRPFLMMKFLRKWVFPLTHPLIAGLMFNLLFSFYHIPQIFNYTFDHQILHHGYHWILVISAFIMWCPVFCTLPQWNRMTDLQQMGYIFFNGVLLTPACALIIFSHATLYPAYVEGSQMIHFFLPPIEDQQLGGTLMKIIQEIVYGTALAYVFFKWYRKEKKKDIEEEAVAEINRLRLLSTH